MSRQQEQKKKQQKASRSCVIIAEVSFKYFYFAEFHEIYACSCSILDIILPLQA
jgi:hypothetical protein